MLNNLLKFIGDQINNSKAYRTHTWFVCRFLLTYNFRQKNQLDFAFLLLAQKLATMG